MKALVYDKETIKNCFLSVYINIKDTSDIRIFEMSDFKNDWLAYIRFQKLIYKDKYRLVSFNGIEFDAQVSCFCIENEKLFNTYTGREIAEAVHDFAQRLIEQKNDTGWLIYNRDQLPFMEIDLCGINNYNNVQKFASLKWIQYNMDWPNVMDMNCKHDDILTEEQIDELKTYCINDCMSTRKLLTYNVPLIEVRRDLSKHFGINLQNLSEPKMVKAILAELLAKDMGLSKREIKNMQTFRDKIRLDEAILPYIKFTTPTLQRTLTTFKKKVLDGEKLKGSFKHKVTYRGMKFSFALGGIHGAKRGLYKVQHGMVIKSFDVKSYYPNLAIRNKWAPAHFDAEKFCKRYEWFYTERLKYPKSNPLNYMFKIILNSAFGLSNEKSSFLKDSFLTMQITCNGQLLLMMLMERLCEEIPGARPIMINTDGGEVILPKEYIPTYEKICKEWEEMTNLVLEFEDYHKLMIWDVNNYIGIFEPYEITRDEAKAMWEKEYPRPLIKMNEGKYYHYPIKLKGRFEINKDLHKNKSYRINSIAIYNHFVHDIPIETSLERCQNIYDFCAGIRMKGGWKTIQTCVEDGILYDEESQKTIRYFASKSGCKLVKKHVEIAEKDIEKKDKNGNIIFSCKKGDKIVKRQQVEAAKTMETVAITIDPKVPFSAYRGKINYDFYLKKIRKEIHTIEPPTIQSSLF